MKVALCFTGQARFVKTGYESISKNINGFDDMDIFVHSWKDNEYEDILKYYNVKDHIIEPQRYDITHNEENLDYRQAPANSGNFVHYSMFYSILKSIELKEKYEKKNNFKYDCVAKLRFDLKFNEKVDFRDYDLKCINGLTPIGNNRVVSDFINFSTSENMDICSGVWNNMPSYKAQGVMMESGEELITAHLRANKLKWISSAKDDENHPHGKADIVSIIRNE